VCFGPGRRPPRQIWPLASGFARRAMSARARAPASRVATCAHR